MSEYCHNTLECRPEDLRCALAIHTQKITDSCRDKDCIEDLRVYLTRESQAVLDTAAAAKVRSAELIYTAIDVCPVAFHRNHYAIDLTFYYKVIADASVGPCRPAAVCGLALFSKRAVLCGENSGAHIFRSDCPGPTDASLPTAVVEAAATNSLGLNSEKPALYYKIPRLSKERRGILCSNQSSTTICSFLERSAAKQIRWLCRDTWALVRLSPPVRRMCRKSSRMP